MSCCSQVGGHEPRRLSADLRVRAADSLAPLFRVQELVREGLEQVLALQIRPQRNRPWLAGIEEPGRLRPGGAKPLHPDRTAPAEVAENELPEVRPRRALCRGRHPAAAFDAIVL